MHCISSVLKQTIAFCENRTKYKLKETKYKLKDLTSSVLGMFINRSSICWFMSESFFEPYLFNEPFDPIHRTAMNESQMGPFGFSSSSNCLINPFTEVTSLLDGYIVNEYQLTFWTVHYLSQLCVFRALRLKHLYKCMSYLYDAVLSFLKFESFPVFFFIGISFQISQLVFHWRKKVMFWRSQNTVFLSTLTSWF